jgi:hypothetical protein
MIDEEEAIRLAESGADILEKCAVDDTHTPALCTTPSEVQLDATDTS